MTDDARRSQRVVPTYPAIPDRRSRTELPSNRLHRLSASAESTGRCFTPILS